MDCPCIFAGLGGSGRWIEFRWEKGALCYGIALVLLYLHLRMTRTRQVYKGLHYSLRHGRQQY